MGGLLVLAPQRANQPGPEIGECTGRTEWVGRFKTSY
jgi:hypothetical protein